MAQIHKDLKVMQIDANWVRTMISHLTIMEDFTDNELAIQSLKGDQILHGRKVRTRTHLHIFVNNGVPFSLDMANLTMLDIAIFTRPV